MTGAMVLRTSRWNPLNTPFLIGTLILTVVLVPIEVVHTHALMLELSVGLGMFLAIGLSVTVGYHRLFSHRAFQAAWPVRLLLLCLGAASFENSALHWASDHRLHHRYVDTDRDPYSIKKGFWYAHWIWVMESTSHPVQGVADLERDPLIRWQDRHYFLIGAIVASIPMGIGLATHNFWGHFVIGVLLRIVLTHHTTFLINSAAHVFGTRPYTDTNSARDNGWLALITYGEGYHNFHHMWPGDYRNGVKWYQWDTAKWAISALSGLGLVWKLNRVSGTIIRRARLRMEEKVLRTKLAEAPPELGRTLQTRLAAAHERLDQALASLQEWRETWKQRKTERKMVQQDAWTRRKAEWKASLFQRRIEFRTAWHEWKAARQAVQRWTAV